ncbi:dihydropteridine reductase-like [Panonychus citri]|uniref:dihydropteridine reductase-like n=1 Tax=Panonychus citri TaxID=50023 RepID=UPI002306F548|nr:dihydropteridine reductase-like [Panonychus citri]
MSSMKRIVIYGGKGALGSTCVNYFKKNNWWVAAVDFAANPDADANVIIKSQQLTDQENEVVSGIESSLGGSKLDAVVCVAGGWAGGNASAKDFVSNTELMIKQSIWTSCIAARLSSLFLNEGGLLVLTGAKAGLEATPGMIGYGLAKAAVHQLTQSLSAEKSGLPNNSTVLTILPITLDTPMNRKFMPKADHSTWTPLEFVSTTFHTWATNDTTNRPKSGSLISLNTVDGKTELTVENK